MPHEFNDSELYPCDNCGEAYPYELMYELNDGRIVCEDCMLELTSDN